MLPMRPCSYPTLLHDHLRLYPTSTTTASTTTTSISSIPLPRPPPRPPRHLHYLVAVLLAVLAVLVVLVVSASKTIISPQKTDQEFTIIRDSSQTKARQPKPRNQSHNKRKKQSSACPLRKTSQSRRTMARQFPKDFLELVLIGGSKDFLCC